MTPLRSTSFHSHKPHDNLLLLQCQGHPLFPPSPQNQSSSSRSGSPRKIIVTTESARPAGPSRLWTPPPTRGPSSQNADGNGKKKERATVFFSLRSPAPQPRPASSGGRGSHTKIDPRIATRFFSLCQSATSQSAQQKTAWLDSASSNRCSSCPSMFHPKKQKFL